MTLEEQFALPYEERLALLCLSATAFRYKLLVWLEDKQKAAIGDMHSFTSAATNSPYKALVGGAKTVIAAEIANNVVTSYMGRVASAKHVMHLNNVSKEIDDFLYQGATEFYGDDVPRLTRGTIADFNDTVRPTMMVIRRDAFASLVDEYRDRVYREFRVLEYKYEDVFKVLADKPEDDNSKIF